MRANRKIVIIIVLLMTFEFVNCRCQNNNLLNKSSPILLLKDLKLNGKDLPITKEQLLDQFGIPNEITPCGSFRPIKYIANNNTFDSSYINYDCYKYKKLKFAVWNNKAQIYSISFDSSDITLTHPLFTLSSKTQIDDLSMFSTKSYINNNESFNRLITPYSKLFTKIKLEDFEWIEFCNGTKNNSFNKIQFTFIKNKLIWAFFDVGE